MFSNSGYNGFSMSNRAVSAYKDGERPWSKWTKAEMLYVIEQSDISEEIKERLKKVPLETLKNLLLVKSSWHHTSSYYNKTDFYSIDIYDLKKITIEDIERFVKDTSSPSKEMVESEMWECEFLEWSGSRRHPKATKLTETGEIKGNWFYRENGSKKSITANGFRKIRKVEIEPDIVTKSHEEELER